jgi:uncharacterized protein (TIGR02145 family)
MKTKKLICSLFVLFVISTFITNCKKITPPAVLPTLLTTSVSAITQTSATSGGNVTQDGGASVTSRGVCWGTTPSPTTSNSKTSDVPGTGIFISSITGLAAGTTYFVRAYATNSAGTAYGNETTFTTTPFLPTITTTAVTAIASTTAISGGNITSDGGDFVTVRGVCWNTSSSPTIANFRTSNLSGTGNFTSTLTGLTSGATYYVRAYAVNSAGTAYGNEVFFTALAALPVLTTASVTSVGSTTATGGGTISSDGGSAITARGICWNTSTAPTTAHFKISVGTGIGNFTGSMLGLTPGTTYYVRAYATNSAGTAYGNEVMFVALAVLPTITTSPVSSVGSATASTGGFIALDGGGAITTRGVCWSTSSNPTISDNKTSDGSGTGSFTSNITGLTAGTTYYVRAYTTNSAGTAYGTQVTFTTTSIQAQIPTLTTASATLVSTTSATSGGNVTSDGGATVTARGVCWSTTTNPTTLNSRTTDGSGTGSFTSNITGLTSGTTYYVRAYATNSAGTAYGSNVTLSTTSSSGGTNTDADGNIFTTVTIGNQVWMASNLKTTKYNDGTAIPLVTDNTAWFNLTTPAYCLNSNVIANKDTYGALYNWFTVNTGKLCPTGWHVPSDAEWTVLTTYLGGNVAGGKLKEPGTSHWVSPNTSATNETGFTAVPGGSRYSSGTFNNIGYYGVWWSATQYSTTYAWNRNVYYDNGTVGRDNYEKQYGFSVRCLRDN